MSREFCRDVSDPGCSRSLCKKVRLISVDVSDIFHFFVGSGAGEREEASEWLAGGGLALIKN